MTRIVRLSTVSVSTLFATACSSSPILTIRIWSILHKRRLKHRWDFLGHDQQVKPTCKTVYFNEHYKLYNFEKHASKRKYTYLLLCKTENEKPLTTLIKIIKKYLENQLTGKNRPICKTSEFLETTLVDYNDAKTL